MQPNLAAVIALALRHYEAPTTTEEERDALLAVISSEINGAEGEAAARALHHRREARAHQMQLTQLFSAKRAA